METKDTGKYFRLKSLGFSNVYVVCLNKNISKDKENIFLWVI